MSAEASARPGLKTRVLGFVERTRERVGWLDHVVRMQERYLDAKGSMQAGAITYFGFLSFFPVLALAFFVVGYVGRVFPDAEANLVTAVESIFPGIIGSGDGQISLSAIESVAGKLGLIGLVGALYTGLGWLSAMRKSLLAVFDLPSDAEPSFVFGKLRDLLTLTVVGVTLIASVAATSLVTGFSADLLRWAGFSEALSPLLRLLTVVIGISVSSVLFFVLFVLLARPRIPRRALWGGALLGAVGFEILKQLSSYLLTLTRGNPAFQAFGIALILVVWINYFSRVVLYAAAWSDTSPSARAWHAAQEASEPQDTADVPALRAGASEGPGADAALAQAATARSRAFLVGAGAGAAAAALAAAVAARRRPR
jgi:membrane protein